MGVSMDIAKCESTGESVLIRDAKRGIAYTCKGCGNPVIPRLGKKRRHHYAHRKGEGHSGCGQTALHEMAKLALSEIPDILLPSITPKIPFFNTGTYVDVLEAEVVDIRSARLEKSVFDFRPDVVLDTEKGMLCVEVFVSHKVDTDKLEKIRKARVNTIELDLSEVDREISYEKLKDGIIDGEFPMYWLYNDIFADLVMHRSLKDVIHTDSDSDVVSCPIVESDSRTGTLSKKFCRGCPFFERHSSLTLDACYGLSYYGTVDDLNYNFDTRRDRWRIEFLNAVKGLGLRLRDGVESSSTESKMLYFNVKLPYLDRGECIVHASKVGEYLKTKNNYNIRCPLCSASMVLRKGKYGYFAGCSSYADTDCRGNRDLLEVRSFRR